MNRRPRNVIMGLWHVNRGPWNVNRSPCNAIMGPWSVNSGLWSVICGPVMSLWDRVM